MIRESLLAVALAVAAVAEPARVKIKVTPQVVMVGGAIRVTCTVPRDARNRELEVGVGFYARESRQLDGEAARVTWEFVFEHIPCVADRAVCLVHSQGLGDAFQDAPINVAGCDGN